MTPYVMEGAIRAYPTPCIFRAIFESFSVQFDFFLVVIAPIQIFVVSTVMSVIRGTRAIEKLVQYNYRNHQSRLRNQKFITESRYVTFFIKSF